MLRHTVIAPDRFALRDVRLTAARARRQGLQALTFEQAAARLAGGFARPVDDDTLRACVQAALPDTALGELDGIKSLPGMTGAAVDTLRKVWRADIDLRSRGELSSRLAAVAALETAVLERLPPDALRPLDLVRSACERAAFAPRVLGPIDIVGVTELAPCWRRLLQMLAVHVPVRWMAGPRSTPAWLEALSIEIVRTEPERPEVAAESAATAYHEAVEALRWARDLIASGRAEPSEVAIAAVTPADYDDHLLALRSDANLDLAFVHGVPVASTRDGQAAAALADVLLRGLTPTRLRRLAAHLDVSARPAPLPEGWTRVLPSSPVSTAEGWSRWLDRLGPADWPDGVDHTVGLRELVQLLQRGIAEAAEVGEQLLRNRALAIWRTPSVLSSTASRAGLG